MDQFLDKKPFFACDFDNSEFVEEIFASTPDVLRNFPFPPIFPDGPEENRDNLAAYTTLQTENKEYGALLVNLASATPKLTRLIVSEQALDVVDESFIRTAMSLWPGLHVISFAPSGFFFDVRTKVIGWTFHPLTGRGGYGLSVERQEKLVRLLPSDMKLQGWDVLPLFSPFRVLVSHALAGVSRLAVNLDNDAELLAACTQLSELLCHSDAKKDVVPIILSALEKNPKLLRFEYRHRGDVFPFDVILPRFAEALASRCPLLQSFALFVACDPSYSRRPNDVRRVSEMLRLAFTSLSKCSDMRRFVLAIPMVGPDCMPALQTMLRSWTHLSSFTWDGNAPESGKAIMLSHLASAPDLSQLWLVKLNITDNDLSKDQVLRRILSKEKLSHVILAGNNIRALPIEAVLSSTPNLRYFHLDYNYGLVFPPKLMSPYDIPGFFEELRSGCCAASSMNLFIVGDGATGKTTLKVKALLGQDPLPADFKKWGGREVRIWMEQSGFTEEECKVADVALNVDRIMNLLLAADSARIEAILCSDSTKNKLVEEARKARGQSQHAAKANQPWLRVSTVGIDSMKVRVCNLVGQEGEVFVPLERSHRGILGFPRAQSDSHSSPAQPPVSEPRPLVPRPISSSGKMPPPSVHHLDSMELHIQDYAGQTEYYSTHHMFLSGSHGAFLVVARAYHLEETKTVEQQWEYWVGYISTVFSRNDVAHVVLAVTHLDAAATAGSDRRIVLSQLRDWRAQAAIRYPNVQVHDVVLVNYDESSERAPPAAEGNCLSLLRQAVVRACRSVASSLYVPLTFVALLERIERFVELSKERSIAEHRPHLPLVRLSDLHAVAARVLQRKESLEKHFKEGKTDVFTRNATLDVQPLIEAQSQTLVVDERASCAELDVAREAESSEAKDTIEPNLILQLESVDRAIRYLHGCSAVWSARHGSRGDALHKILASLPQPKGSADERELMAQDDIVILRPMSWFTQVLASFVGEAEKIRILNKKGVVSWNSLMEQKGALGCTTEDDVTLVMAVLSSIGVCIHLPDGYTAAPSSSVALAAVAEQKQQSSRPGPRSSSSSSSRGQRYLFPCLLPPLAGDADIWAGVSVDSKSASDLMYVGRRISCQTAYHRFPSAFFPALQVKLWSEMSALHRGHMLLQFEPNALAREGIDAEEKLSVRQAVVLLAPDHTFIDVIVRCSAHQHYTIYEKCALDATLEAVCNVVLSVIEDYSGLAICVSALCSVCLHSELKTSQRSVGARAMSCHGHIDENALGTWMGGSPNSHTEEPELRRVDVVVEEEPHEDKEAVTAEEVKMARTHEEDAIVGEYSRAPRDFKLRNWALFPRTDNDGDAQIESIPYDERLTSTVEVKLEPCDHFLTCFKLLRGFDLSPPRAMTNEQLLRSFEDKMMSVFQAFREDLRHLGLPRYVLLLPSEPVSRKEKVQDFAEMSVKVMFPCQYADDKQALQATSSHDRLHLTSHPGYDIKIRRQWLVDALPYMKFTCSLLLSAVDFFTFGAASSIMNAVDSALPPSIRIDDSELRKLSPISPEELKAVRAAVSARLGDLDLPASDELLRRSATIMTTEIAPVLKRMIDKQKHSSEEEVGDLHVNGVGPDGHLRFSCSRHCGSGPRPDLAKDAVHQPMRSSKRRCVLV